MRFYPDFNTIEKRGLKMKKPCAMMKEPTIIKTGPQGVLLSRKAMESSTRAAFKDSISDDRDKCNIFS